MNGRVHPDAIDLKKINESPSSALPQTHVTIFLRGVLKIYIFQVTKIKNDLFYTNILGDNLYRHNRILRNRRILRNLQTLFRTPCGRNLGRSRRRNLCSPTALPRR